MKKEFYRLKSLLEGKDIKIVIKNNFRDKLCYGYVYYEKAIPEIYVKKCTYSNMIDTLLHEYGHILDFNKYKNSKRRKCLGRHGDYDTNKVKLKKSKKFKSFCKLNILKSEIYAYKFGEKFAKTNKIMYDILDYQVNIYKTFIINLFQLYYGMPFTNDLENDLDDTFDMYEFEDKLEIVMKTKSFKKVVNLFKKELNV